VRREEEEGEDDDSVDVDVSVSGGSESGAVNSLHSLEFLDISGNLLKR